MSQQLPLFVERHAIDHEALARCLYADRVAVDIETETRWPGWGPRHDFGLSYPAPVKIIGLAWREEATLHTTALAAPFEVPALTFLSDLFHSPATIVAHNAVFDLRQLSKLTKGHLPVHIWDTMVMARLLHPASRLRYGLLGIADALGIHYSEAQVALKEARPKLHDLPLATAVAYAEADARLALEIAEHQQALGGDPELIDWECRAVREYCRMAAEGMRLHLPYIETYRAELETTRFIAERLAADGLPDPESPKARVRYVYETKGLPLPEWEPGVYRYFTWKGYRRLRQATVPVVQLEDLSTRSSVIESYAEEGSPYAAQLRDLAAWVRTDWLISTLDSLVEHAALDRRVHSLITIATDTGRRASSHPAMQNWKMPAMAGVAVGDEGFTLVEIDYSNAENVMAAMLAGDDAMAAACRTEDFHSAMAVSYFGDDWAQADAAARRRLRAMSKRISYGTLYGMGAKSLGRSLGITTSEAQALLRAKDVAFADLARMRARTSPPVAWLARPDLVQNRKKWGKGQIHPRMVQKLTHAGKSSVKPLDDSNRG